MTLKRITRGAAVAALMSSSLWTTGCQNPHGRSNLFTETHIPPPPAKHGATTEGMWRRMEENAEAADFIINEHDFDDMQSVRLNEAGKDHLKMVAARLLAGAPFPVIIERSKWSLDPHASADDFNYPIHQDPELDNSRRDAIASVLGELGVPYSDQRVVVGESFTQHTPSNQAIQNFGQFNQAPRNGGLFNQGFGPGGFGGGGFGGFGRGFF